MNSQKLTTPMNEWGFISQDTLVSLGNSATINKFKQGCGLMVEERTLHSTPHSFWPSVSSKAKKIPNYFHRIEYFEKTYKY